MVFERCLKSVNRLGRIVMLLGHDSASKQRCKSLVDNKMVALAKELKSSISGCGHL
jgi:hypothetical protein